MALCGEHKVVRNPDWDGFRENDLVLEQRVHTSNAPNVEVQVNPTIMMEDKVADSVRTLDRVLVAIKRVQKPRVEFFEERTGRLVRPKHVFAEKIEQMSTQN
jgi:hypothetical protein